MKQRIVFALLMGIIPTCIISFSLVSINYGWGPLLRFLWLRSWAIAYIIVVPLIIMLGPIVARIVARLFRQR